MDSVINGAVIYFVLLLVLRIAGRRTLRENTNFDLVLLLIISETTQQAMIREDSSLTNAVLLISTIVSLDILFSVLKQRSSFVRALIEPQPLSLMRDGRLLKDRMDAERVEADEILAAARESLGLERMEQIKHAVIEQNGTISVVPAKSE